MAAVIGWLAVALVLVILLVLILVLICRRAGASNAMGYTRGHGFCPNMGACDGCDICEED